MKVSTFLVAALLPYVCFSQLFQGTSILLRVNPETDHPGDTTIETASFYCYMTAKGYLTFGWWLGTKSDNIDISPVRPDPAELSLIDWFEVGEGRCERFSCQFHVRNYNITALSLASRPAFEEDYIIHSYQLSDKGERGLMFASYFDRTGGKHAVGVRTTVKGKECYHAYTTLKRLQREKNVELPFEMTDPCDLQHIDLSQKILRLD